MTVELTVVGSINLDLVARVERLPRPGETVGGGELARYPGRQGREPGGRGGAARRAGADGRRGRRRRARRRGARGPRGGRRRARAGARGGDRRRADLRRRRRARTRSWSCPARTAGDAAGGRGRGALPARGARRGRARRRGEGVVLRAQRRAGAADRPRARPAGRQPARARGSGRRERSGKLVAVTYGAEGAALYEDGREVARAAPPRVTAVDGTAAGDAFTACLSSRCSRVGRARRRSRARAPPGRSPPRALGAQPSLPTAAEVDAILAR